MIQIVRTLHITKQVTKASQTQNWKLAIKEPIFRCLCHKNIESLQISNPTQKPLGPLKI